MAQNGRIAHDVTHNGIKAHTENSSMLLGQRETERERQRKRVKRKHMNREWLNIKMS